MTTERAEGCEPKDPEEERPTPPDIIGAPYREKRDGKKLKGNRYWVVNQDPARVPLEDWIEVEWVTAPATAS